MKLGVMIIREEPACNDFIEKAYELRKGTEHIVLDLCHPAGDFDIGDFGGTHKIDNFKKRFERLVENFDQCDAMVILTDDESKYWIYFARDEIKKWTHGPAAAIANSDAGVVERLLGLYPETASFEEIIEHAKGRQGAALSVGTSLFYMGGNKLAPQRLNAAAPG